MYWLYLGLAILLEVIGTTSMKISDGMSKLAPSIIMFVCYGASFSMLALALKRIDVSIAYAIWSGLGIVVITIIGFLYFNEQLNTTKLVAIALILVGVVLLNLSDRAVG